MSNEKMMYQCLLVRGPENQIAWIDEKGAKIGHYVEIKELQQFWKVEAVYHPPRTVSAVKEIERKAHRGTRSFSDI